MQTNMTFCGQFVSAYKTMQSGKIIKLALHSFALCIILAFYTFQNYLAHLWTDFWSTKLWHFGSGFGAPLCLKNMFFYASLKKELSAV